jgi:hypothetical protein
MKSFLIYTFRTFPYIDQLTSLTENIFVFNKLKEDILDLEKILKKNELDYVLGIAKSSNRSVFETKGVNKFNNGNIIKDGKEKYPLYYPKDGYMNIGVNNSYTKSFCNWGIYNVGRIIENNNLKMKHSFVHILENDIKVLKKFLV